MTLTDDAGQSVVLAGKLGTGGEADVYAVVGNGDLVAKIYHAHRKPAPEREAKLHAMVGNPPADPTRSQGHVSICWPRALLFHGPTTCAGFLMHRVDLKTNQPVLNFYNPQARLQIAPGFTWGYLIRTAAHIASVVEGIHAKGYVIGDVNESNFLVSDSTLVTLVDCDSMQVPKGTGKGVFRCTVGKGDFTAPELQGRDFGSVDREASHDNFALGILTFLLLMEGVHPFAGVWRGKGDPPAIEKRIRSGYSPYADASLVSPMPAALPIDLLSPMVKSLVIRCFRQGHTNPALRPAPREWREALTALERDLVTCAVNSNHRYPRHLARCVWCERAASFGSDSFPPPASHQQPLQRTPFAPPTRPTFVTPAAPPRSLRRTRPVGGVAATTAPAPIQTRLARRMPSLWAHIFNRVQLSRKMLVSAAIIAFIVAALADSHVRDSTVRLLWLFDFAVRRLASATGIDPRFMTDIGVSYQRGRGVTRDDAEALRWYRNAAEHGERNGMTLLCFLLYQGGEGVIRNEAEALVWCRKAADAGDPNSVTFLANRITRFSDLGLSFNYDSTLNVSIDRSGQPPSVRLTASDDRFFIHLARFQDVRRGRLSVVASATRSAVHSKMPNLIIGPQVTRLRRLLGAEREGYAFSATGPIEPGFGGLLQYEIYVLQIKNADVVMQVALMSNGVDQEAAERFSMIADSLDSPN